MSGLLDMRAEVCCLAQEDCPSSWLTCLTRAGLVGIGSVPLVTKSSHWTRQNLPLPRGSSHQGRHHLTRALTRPTYLLFSNHPLSLSSSSIPFLPSFLNSTLSISNLHGNFKAQARASHPILSFSGGNKAQPICPYPQPALTLYPPYS